MFQQIAWIACAIEAIPWTITRQPTKKCDFSFQEAKPSEANNDYITLFLSKSNLCYVWMKTKLLQPPPQKKKIPVSVLSTEGGTDGAGQVVFSAVTV